MISRNILSIRESPVGSGTESPVGSGLRFAMVPWEVITDPRLTHLDVRVYCVLAACRRASTVKIGTRLLAKYGCTSQRRICESVKRIISFGYVEKAGALNGARAQYRLTAAQFGAISKQSIGAELSDVDAPKKAIWAPCTKCRRDCRSRASSGWCHACVKESDDRRAVMAAYSANPSATEQEIWSAVKIGENTRRAAGIRKAIRELQYREATA